MFHSLKIQLSLITIISAILFNNPAVTEEYEIIAEIESKRKGNLVTILLNRKPLKKSYFILEKRRIIGRIDIIRVNHFLSGSKIQAIAKYFIHKNEDKDLLRTGTKIGLLKKSEKYIRDFSDPPYIEKILYSKRIISEIDEREMVLVPSGKFIFGSNSGDRDEYPEKVVYLDDYYIDRYEVSNRDYKRFVDSTNSRSPISWIDGNYDDNLANLPVLVTHYEAEEYAKWCGKRLPGEKEWEKAAKGSSGLIPDKKGSRKIFTYPWGVKFSQNRLNSLEFWLKKGIKEKYGLNSENYLSVFSFKNKGSSPYGAVNMSGNALEWTSSWYLPYKDNFYKDDRYGTQYKVVRGGAWYSNKYKVRTSNREIGGIPNLYQDNIAGFRCIKDTTYLDRIE